MNARQCPDDLLVASRSRWLSDLERQALSAHLARCGECRAGEVAAGLFRRPVFTAGSGGTVTDADRALIERVAERASAAVLRSSRHAQPGWRRMAVAVAVVILLGLGGIASAWIGRSFVAPRSLVIEPVANRPVVFRRGHRSEGTLPPPAPPVGVPAAPARALPAKRVAAARPARDLAVAPAPSETAASLFAAATRARHDGDLRRAVTLYTTLRTAFPDSDQARVASVSVGDLLLRLDEPARALPAFDGYLSSLGSAPLREEALVGRARCLKKLGEGGAQGRVEEEEETWARLVREFPGSAYGPAARQRLGELRGAR